MNWHKQTKIYKMKLKLKDKQSLNKLNKNKCSSSSPMNAKKKSHNMKDLTKNSQLN